MVIGTDVARRDDQNEPPHLRQAPRQMIWDSCACRRSTTRVPPATSAVTRRNTEGRCPTACAATRIYEARLYDMMPPLHSNKVRRHGTFAYLSATPSIRIDPCVVGVGTRLWPTGRHVGDAQRSLQQKQRDYAWYRTRSGIVQCTVPSAKKLHFGWTAFVCPPQRAVCVASAANHSECDPFATHTGLHCSLPRLPGPTGGPLLEMSGLAQIALSTRSNERVTSGWARRRVLDPTPRWRGPRTPHTRAHEANVRWENAPPRRPRPRGSRTIHPPPLFARVGWATS